MQFESEVSFGQETLERRAMVVIQGEKLHQAREDRRYPKNGGPSREKKAYNRGLSRFRVRIEHKIRELQRIFKRI